MPEKSRRPESPRTTIPSQGTNAIRAATSAVRKSCRDKAIRRGTSSSLSESSAAVRTRRRFYSSGTFNVSYMRVFTVPAGSPNAYAFKSTDKQFLSHTPRVRIRGLIAARLYWSQSFSSVNRGRVYKRRLDSHTEQPESPPSRRT